MKLEKIAINAKELFIKVESSALNSLGQVRNQFHGYVEKKSGESYISDENRSGIDNKTSSKIDNPLSKVDKPSSKVDKPSSDVKNSDGNLERSYSFDERGDVPGWVLVVLMTTGLVTAIWTIAAPRLSAILKNSLDAMNGIR